jgi:glycosyltransferase involved in cell wall biosynthesis
MESRLYIVIPCFNEEEMLEKTTKVIEDKMERMLASGLIDSKSRVLYVNDGSSDGTWQLIRKIHAVNPMFTGISLARNRGHQNALLAGLMIAKQYADVVISMDADLQDDIEVMDKMLLKYEEGNDIVYGVRSSRKSDSFFKRFTAEAFYKLMTAMGVKTVFNHADYRLTSRRVLENLEDYQEVNLFLRGIFPLIGYSSATVSYERKKREAGESKYPLKKMLSFAWDGITSFTVKPLRAISIIGILISLFSALILLYFLITKLFGYTVTGWTSVICSIWLVGGLQLFSLGIIGEYIGKIYGEVKHRPRFMVAESLLEEYRSDLN